MTWHLVTWSRCLLVTTACIAATGCNGRSAQPPIWLGHVAALSGPDKQAGESAARGIRLAVEEINKDLDQGLGRPFKVIHGDSRGDLAAFESEAVRLAAVNRVSFLFGGATPEEVERLERAGVPVIAPLGARRRTMSEAIYCTGLAPAQTGKALAQFAALELGADSVVIVTDERRDDFVEVGDVADREFRAAWTNKNPKATPMVRRVRLSKDAKTGELAELLLQKEVADANCKAVIFAGKTENLREWVTVPLLCASDPGNDALAAAKARGNDIYWVTSFVADTEGEGSAPAAAEFAKRYKQAFQEDADVHAALAYEDVKLLHHAMLQTKDALTSTRIREELLKLKDLAGLTGPLTFTADRQLRRPAFIVHIDSGGVKTVKRYNPEN